MAEVLKFVPRDRGRLNPKLFEAGRVRPEVREKLLVIASEFIEYLNIDLDVESVVLTGSNAGYGWGPQSDCDVHVLADLADAGDPDLVRKYCDMAKSAWGSRHTPTIRGIPVEVYVEQSGGSSTSPVYDLGDDDWSIKPTHQIPEEPDPEVARAAAEMASELSASLGDPDAAKAALDSLYDRRRAGLKSDGEASVDNLAFKTLRNSGAIGMMWDYVMGGSDELSIPEGIVRAS